jgi:hypothetical protein
MNAAVGAQIFGIGSLSISRILKAVFPKLKFWESLT